MKTYRINVGLLPRLLLLTVGFSSLVSCASNGIIQKTGQIDALPDKVWQVLATKYGEVDEWASAVAHAEPVVDSKGAETGRVCSTDLGKFKENIITLDDENHILSYRAESDDMPSFVKGITNTWRLSEASSGTTAVSSTTNLQVSPMFGVMLPPMKKKIGSTVEQTMEELKYFVEEGKPHPRKVESSHTVQN